MAQNAPLKRTREISLRLSLLLRLRLNLRLRLSLRLDIITFAL